MHSASPLKLTIVSPITAMARHRKPPAYDADEVMKNRFAILFGIVIVAVMGAVLIVAGLMN